MEECVGGGKVEISALKAAPVEAWWSQRARQEVPELEEGAQPTGPSRTLAGTAFAGQEHKTSDLWRDWHKAAKGADPVVGTIIRPAGTG